MSLLRDFVKSRLNPHQSSDASAGADQADVSRVPTPSAGGDQGGVGAAPPASVSGNKPTTGQATDARQVDNQCQVPPAPASGNKPTTGQPMDPHQVDNQCQLPPASIKPPTSKPPAQEALGTRAVPSQTRVIIME